MFKSRTNSVSHSMHGFGQLMSPKLTSVPYKENLKANVVDKKKNINGKSRF